MTPDDFVDRPFQHVHPQRATDAHGVRDVVEGTARFELFQEPETLLCERERQRPIPWHALDRRFFQTLCSLFGQVDLLGQCGHRGRLENVAQRQLDLERLPDAGDHLRGQQRVAAEFEKVVVHTDFFQPEHFRPDPGHNLFRGRTRGHKGLFEPAGAFVGLGQGPPVHLSVRRQGQGLQLHKRGRHHVLRQPIEQVAPQLAGGNRFAGRRDVVGHDPLVVGLVLANDHGHLADGVVSAESGFDFAELDPVAPDLHLRVHATEELDVAVGQVAGQVARSVEARPRFPAERVRDEFLRGQLRPVPVAARQPRSGNAHFTRNADGHGLEVAIQDVDP